MFLFHKHFVYISYKIKRLNRFKYMFNQEKKIINIKTGLFNLSYCGSIAIYFFFIRI